MALDIALLMLSVRPCQIDDFKKINDAWVKKPTTTCYRPSSAVPMPSCANP